MYVPPNPKKLFRMKRATIEARLKTAKVAPVSVIQFLKDDGNFMVRLFLLFQLQHRPTPGDSFLIHFTLFFAAQAHSKLHVMPTINNTFKVLFRAFANRGNINMNNKENGNKKS